MISSIFLRSPQKTGGLFDTGFAGDATGITSLDLNATAELFNHPFKLGSIYSANSTISNSLDDSRLFAGEKLEQTQSHQMDTLDMLNPLDDYDQLADDSLDAFVDLDIFLNEDSFFEATAEVKPVIDVPELDMKSPTSNFCLGWPVDINFVPEPTITGSILPTKKHKTATVEPVISNPKQQNMFEFSAECTVSSVVDAQLDHDYTNKRKKSSIRSGSAHKSKVSVTSTSEDKETEMISLQWEASTSSDNFDASFGEVFTDKQTVRRLKNNVASKRSREQRKKKFADLDVEAEQLIEANEVLRKKILELERLSKEMKAQLVAKMSR